MKYFTTVNDLNDPATFINDAVLFKSRSMMDISCTGKTIGLLFMNQSLRTRLSTQKAAASLGMNIMVLNADKESWSIEWEDHAIMEEKTEHIQELAEMLSIYCDIIAIRSFASLTDKQKDISEFHLLQLLKYSTVPVISLESATLHPLQSLADMMTIAEQKRVVRPKVVLTWAPHIKPLPHAVSNSFCEWMNFMDADFVIANPRNYNLSPDFTKKAIVTNDQEEALENADFVYVKSWSSFEQYGTLPEVKENWFLNERKMDLTNNAKIMHCLPVRRNLELPDELLHPSKALVHQQAANRYHAAKFVISQLAKHNFNKTSPVPLNEFIYE